MEVNKGFKVKIYPNADQKSYFLRNFGCSRKVYNFVLAKYCELYQKDPNIKPTTGLFNSLLKEAKIKFPFLKDVESTSLQQSVRDLSMAFNNFFKNPKTKFPVFHTKKKTRLSFRQTIPSKKKIIQANRLSLRKYGEVKFQTSKEYFEILNNPQTKINNITITYDGLNFYAIINIKDHVDEWTLTGKILGCDINSNKNGWLVTNNGVKEQFNVNHENQMIRTLNRLLAKCRKNSRRWKKLHKRLIKWYNKRTNKLEDYIDQLSTRLVKEYDTIVFEKNYSEIKILIGGEENLIFPLYKFIEKLKYKFKWHKPKAKGIVLVDAKNTSKKCHNCNYINKDLNVKTRTWKCPKCGKTHDRDINASINILNRRNYGVLA